MDNLQVCDFIKKFNFELINVSNKLQNLKPDEDKERKQLLKEQNGLNSVVQVLSKYRDILN